MSSPDQPEGGTDEPIEDTAAPDAGVTAADSSAPTPPEERAPSKADAPSDADAAPEQEPMPTEDAGFASLGLMPELVNVVAELGYEEPTAIQREAIPTLLAGNDLLGLAATGTGKTAAFALPLLQRLAEGPSDSQGPRALVLCPTRELAMQVAEAIHTYGRAMRIRVLPVYGGAAMSHQLRSLRRGVDVVVGTPGRARDHLERGSMRLDNVKVVVLDEADEMLDMGFQEDLEALLGATPDKKQTALFSATFPARLRGIVAATAPDAVRVEVARERTAPGEVPRIRQVAYIVRGQHKKAALTRVLDMEAPKAALVFCRRRVEVDDLADALDSRGYRALALHGGLNQPQRDRVMSKLREGSADLIVATDVAARGIDIGHLSHVINFDAPTAPEQYMHRIGRTGRAGREGVAITLLEPRERRLVESIRRLTQQPCELAQVPTVADLRSRRLGLVAERVREAAASGGLDEYADVFESLVEELDFVEIAAAAIKALHESTWAEGEGERDIPEVQDHRDRDRGRYDRRDDRPQRRDGPRHDGPRRDGPPGRGGPRHGGPSHGGPRHDGPRHDGPRRDGPPGRGGPSHGDRRGVQRDGGRDWARIYIGLGRGAGIQPGDLFGAIVNETGMPRDDVGAIEIAQQFSLVAVPSEKAEQVIQALRHTTLRGRTAYVRRDRGR